MAADFNAGSIEGTLDLDTRPFLDGLRVAKMKADEVEKKRVTAKAELDTAPLTREKDKANVELDRLGHKKVTAKADLDITEALLKAEMLNKVLDAGGLGQKTTGFGMGLAHIGLMVSGVMSLAAALGPATVAVGAFGAAATTAFAGAGISLGLFSKMVEGDMKTIQKAIKAHQQLAGAAGQAETAYKHLTAAWQGLQKQTGGAGYKFLTAAFTGLAGVLPKLAPLIRSTASGMTDLVKTILMLTHTQLFGTFIKQLSQFMHGFLSGAGPVLYNLLSSFMRVFIALRPLMGELGAGILHLSAAVSTFTSGPGLGKFVAMAQADLPKVIALVTALVHGLMHLSTGLAPLSGPALHFITALVTAIGSLNIAPLASGLGQVLKAIEPLLPVAEKLLNVVLQPLGQLLSALAHGPIHALTQSLGTELAPAFGALKGILEALVQPVSDFLGSIANLVNPTGVHLAATLLKSLEGVVKTVAPAFGHLAVAVESVIDNGINVLTPLIPKLTPVLHGAAVGAAALADGMAKILSHKDVSYAILAAVAAFKAYKLIVDGVTKAQAIFTAVTEGVSTAIATVRDMSLLTRAELALLWIQEKALAVIGGVVRIATKAWEAAQWLLNAALDANPIGLVTIAIAALAAGIIYAYKHSQTFRDIVDGAFHAIADAATWMWDNVLKPLFKLWLDTWLNVVGGIVDGAAKAFGWVPGLGGKLKTAAKWFDGFKNDVNAALGGIQDKTVHVGIAVSGSEGGTYNKSVHPKVGGGGRAADGGTVPKTGQPYADRHPYLLADGEEVISNRHGQADRHRGLLKAINAGRLADGGTAGPGLHIAVTGQSAAYDAVRQTVSKIGGLVDAAAQHLKSTFVPHYPPGTAGGGGAVGNIGGSGVVRWSPLVLRALAMLGQPASLLPAVLHRMMIESGGNPMAINNWDTNAAAGDPSRGLMQTIGSTFNAYAGPFRGLGIYNPMANIYAGLNYALHAYGNIYGPMMQAGGYASGTPWARRGWHMVGEHGPEAMWFNGGERVLSHPQSIRALHGGGPGQITREPEPPVVNVRVFLGDTELRDVVRTEVNGVFQPLTGRVRQGSV